MKKDPAAPQRIAFTGKARLGLSALKPVPLIALEQQIAQKIYAATQPGSQRAHDLVDLQVQCGSRPVRPSIRSSVGAVRGTGNSAP